MSDSNGMKQKITVLGIGNTLMGDDGVGAVVVRELSRLDLGPDVTIVERPNADMGLLRHFLDSGTVIVVDALSAGSEPGAIFRFTPDEAHVTSLRSNNIHGMGVGFLITNARLSGADPNVIVIGVQVGVVGPKGDVLSAEVADAVPHMVELVQSEVGRVAS